jgi:hypothetical protein
VGEFVTVTLPLLHLSILHATSEGVGPLRSSILSLIDLAGSENAKLTNATGGRQREGGSVAQKQNRWLAFT